MMAALPTIAIVNDDVIYLDLLKSYFEGKEFRVLLAEPNGKVFLSKLAACNELPDICILDTGY